VKITKTEISRSPAQNSSIHSAGEIKLAVEEIPRQVLLQRFTQGSTIGASILQSLGKNRYIIGFAGMKLLAESTIELPVGKRLGLEVASLDPKIHLKVLDADDASIGTVLKRLGFNRADQSAKEIIDILFEKELPIDRETVRKAIELVKRGLTPRQAVRAISNQIPASDKLIGLIKSSELSFSDSLEKLVQKLRSLKRDAEALSLEKSMTFSKSLDELFDSHPLRHERRILAMDLDKAKKDGKSLLLELANSPDENKEVRESAKELLDRIEARFIAGEPEQNIPFSINDDGLKDAELTAGKDSKRTYVRLRLNTSGFGNVVLAMDAVNKTLGFSFGVETAEARKAMAGGQTELNSALDSIGFKIESITIDVIKAKEKESQKPLLGLDLKI